MRSKVLSPLQRALTVIVFGLVLAPDDARSDSLKSPTQHEHVAIENALDRLAKADPASAAAVHAARTVLRDGGQPRIKRVVNGTEDIGFPGAGALLKGSDAKSARAWCSGTLISTQAFLTAAHCIVDDPHPDHYQIFFQHAGFYSVQEILWQKDQYQFPNGDVAVLRLSRPVEGISPLLINRIGTPIDGATGIIVGFGRTGGENADYGIKRVGSIKTAKCEEPRFASFTANLVCWKYDAVVNRPGEDSNTCNGDSGGGLHIGTERVVAGVTSGGMITNCLAGDRSYDANVFQYRKWIDESAQELPPITGAALGASDRDWTVLGDTKSLTEDSPQVQYQLNVPEQTALLRVAMNGQDNGSGENDFDLYVLRGDTASTTGAVCAEDGPGQFAFCEIRDPTPGRWTILVARKKGAGLVQTVATLIPATPTK